MRVIMSRASTARAGQAGPRVERATNKPRSVADRIVKVLVADCGLDPGTKMLSKVSEWMETSPLVHRNTVRAYVCGADG